VPGTIYLLAVLGHTPQILTETLYALLIQRRLRVERICVLTTLSGKRQVEEHLLGEGEGWFHAFCRDYPEATAALRFGLEDVVTHGAAAEAYEDIRDVRHSEQFAGLVMSTVRRLTAASGSVVYASLAGGRKTMSVYLATAMQFFGRPQDRLYHVLVSPREFEGHTQFYYPPPEPVELALVDGGTLSTARARIDLVEVPFVRLRGKLGQWFGREDLSFDAMVRLAQEELRQLEALPELVLEVDKRKVWIGERSFTLPSFDFAVYRHYVERSLNRSMQIEGEEDWAHFEPGGINGFERDARDAIYRMAGRRPPEGWDVEAEWEKVQQAISRIRRVIAGVLPTEALRQYYEVSSVGAYGEKRYGVKLDRSLIRVQG